ncbi:MAG: aldehyde dehydrogenase family protein [Saprospiraceae bacterium]|nr:aldehyde dehydrogenase family protein [Saprospiraceae bacterium]
MKLLNQLGIKPVNPAFVTGLRKGGRSKTQIYSYSPVDGKRMAAVAQISRTEYDKVVAGAVRVQRSWRQVPSPKRGDLVRQIGDAFRANKSTLGKLVSYEMGKSLQEGQGEVQEIIDICDFAVGLSRQLYGLTMHSERPGHRMYEQWHPLGVVGIISAFNFPVAVWSWNAMLALICGNTIIWKPSEKTPLCAVAVMNIIEKVLKINKVYEGVINLIHGDAVVGQWLAQDHRIALISATGSTRMGKSVAQTVASRLGKTLLELGGNNAIIITPSADLKIVLTGAVFGAVGTAGQRCTSTRRLIIHESIYDKVVSALRKAYSQIKIGDPLNASMHMGPLIDEAAVDNYLQALQEIIKQGGQLLTPSGVLTGKGFNSKCYVRPVIAAVNHGIEIVQQETFAPILYVMKYQSLQDAIHIHNDVPQGLSSAIMTNDIKEAELFLSVQGSDCGIANVNIGTSGAEIGGAFGGEKETGGGRESGSDAWKNYMRRQTNTINYSSQLPLAQGISFSL